MRTIKRLVSSLVVLFSSAAAHATTYVVPSDDVLVGKANAIVIARALTSYAEESDKHGIETVTVLSIEDVLKGNLSSGNEIKIRVIGGVLEKRVKLVPGTPHFTDGERVLVFLNSLDSGHYAVTDFGLGVFQFQVDDTGREVLTRNATEIHGWNTDGTVHHEARRDAERFLTFVRGIDRQQTFGYPDRRISGVGSRYELRFSGHTSVTHVAADADAFPPGLAKSNPEQIV